MQAPENVIRIGDTAKRLAKCFGVNVLMPVNIPVWVADVNCEEEPYADVLIGFNTADGTAKMLAENADYANLKSGRRVTGLCIFLRGEGYRSPEPMTFKDDFGPFQQPGQLGPFDV
jgi:hypothetical protein